MTVIEKTKVYAAEVAEAALNAFNKQARGDIPAPGNAENVRLFTAKGGSAVTLSNETVSAAVVYDPEASLRNGQLSVMVYERKADSTIKAAQVVNLGRPSEEFLSVGVLSSGLKVFNSSGVDVIGGTQTSAVLTSVPRDISTITSTDLANFTANHERDLASGIVSRDDATLTLSMSNHFGTKMCLSRPNTTGNLVRRAWDDGIGARRTTTGESLGPTANSDIEPLGSTIRSDAQVIAGLASNNVAMLGANVLDSNNLTGSNNPLTMATYNIAFTCHSVYTGIGTTPDPDFSHDYVALALDASGVVLARKDMRYITPVTNGASIVMITTGSLTSLTKPIHRVIVAATREQANQGAGTYSVGNSSAELEAFEETSDIPARAVHVTVLEGLNVSATINLNSFAVLTGVPDSSNIFISQSVSDDSVYDNNAVEIFLRSVARVMPRAFTIGGHGAFSQKLTAMYGDESMNISFQAMSFDRTVERVKHFGKLAKLAGKELASAIEKAEPFLSTTGRTMSMLPGPAGAVGEMMTMGGAAARGLSSRR